MRVAIGRWSTRVGSVTEPSFSLDPVSVDGTIDLVGCRGQNRLDQQGATISSATAAQSPFDCTTSGRVGAFRSQPFSTSNCGHQEPSFCCCLVGIDAVAGYSPGNCVRRFFVGDIESSNIFRQLRPATAKTDNQAFLDGARDFVDDVVCRSAPQYTDDNFKLTQEDIQKKFATRSFSREEVDPMHGMGGSRPMIGFLHTQANGKQKALMTQRRVNTIRSPL